MRIVLLTVVGSTLLLSCGSFDLGAPSLATTPAVGTSTIAWALGVTNSCAKTGPDFWSYSVSGGKRFVWLVRHPMPEDLISVAMMDDEQGMALGSVNLTAERVSWFDDRERVGEGTLAADGRTTEYRPSSPEEQALEWKTERGQLVVQLAMKARAICDSTHVSDH